MQLPLCSHVYVDARFLIAFCETLWPVGGNVTTTTILYLPVLVIQKIISDGKHAVCPPWEC